MSKETKFKVGDMCALNSGGPMMTVSDVTVDGWITCEWFAGDEEERDSHAFLSACLTLIGEDG